MKRKRVKSTNIKSVGHSREDSILEVEFNSGKVYHYFNVSEELYNSLLEASSVGKFFNKYVKKSHDFKAGEYVKSHNFYICGRAGAGKDTLADYLINKLAYTRVKFAYPVYAIGYNYFGMKEKDRKLLNFIGTISGRKLNENIWVNRLIEDLRIVKHTGKELYNQDFKFVSSDVRFKNEHQALKNEGWIGIYVDTPKDVRIQRLIKRDGKAQTDMLECESEISVDEFKDELIRVDTSGTIEESYKNFQEVLNSLR